MTQEQRAELKTRRWEVPFLDREDHNLQEVTKAEASVLLQMIHDRVEPSSEYLWLLGRGISLKPGSSMGPLEGHHSELRRTQMQVKWITTLAQRLSVPSEAMQAVLTALTYGEASLLITELRNKALQLSRHRKAIETAYSKAYEDNMSILAKQSGGLGFGYDEPEISEDARTSSYDTLEALGNALLFIATLRTSETLSKGLRTGPRSFKEVEYSDDKESSDEEIQEDTGTWFAGALQRIRGELPGTAVGS
ncbi:hypothetical protein BN946_scf184876.g7 [Trametes cinnabarina]|uniref:Uncharacterized protein n=1 Tax=Pycnoporus cinnabarinus TaxID=5643 RepID=A0A060SV63_PYCCI|nr:hypothetical protein BN946_scf184876.g7 [Trametes cinnabarina]